MRARHRHFNPRAAGANLVLDAKYITQSDGTAVSTWSDRSGGGYDATQGTSENRPTFKTAQQGGCGGVSFDGSNDFLTGTYNPSGVPRAVYIVFKAAASALGTLFQTPLTPNTNGWIARWGSVSSTWYISGDVSTTNQTIGSQSNATNSTIGSWASDSSRNVSFVRDGSSVTVSGNAPSAVNSSTSPGYRLGSINTSANVPIQWWNGLVFSVAVFGDQSIAAPLRRRCEHASAYSYKIACN